MIDFPLPTHYSEFDHPPYRNTVRIQYESQRTAQDYLDFAIQDLEHEKDDKQKINAFSNAKRALHLQVETLASAFGCKLSINKKNANFHSYLEYCRKCGIVTPRILRKVNSIRNAIEHDYYSPTIDEVENIVDVVELFLAATERYFFQFPIELEFLPLKFENEHVPKINSIKLLPFTGVINLTLETCDVLSIDAKNDNFFIWLRYLTLSMYRS